VDRGTRVERPADRPLRPPPSTPPPRASGPSPAGEGPTRPVAVVTGSNRGIGRALAGALGERGYHLVLLCRTEAKGRDTVRELERETGARGMDWLAADLEDPEALRAAAEDAARRFTRIHLLVNNAGLVSRRYRETATGVEATLAVNHLAQVRFTLPLLPFLRAGALDEGEARIINVSSGAHARRFDPGAFDGPRGFSPGKAYAQSKLLNLLFTFDLAPRLETLGIRVNAVHPGLVNTHLLRTFLPGGLLAKPLSALVGMVSQTPEEGARTPLFAATDPGLQGVSGRYFRKEKEAEPASVARDPGTREDARRWTAGLTGMDWGEAARIAVGDRGVE
jgi:NAD(P)-dependent dehydrogenase (short-subunit alcohol dehydrogenase family)